MRQTRQPHVVFQVAVSNRPYPVLFLVIPFTINSTSGTLIAPDSVFPVHLTMTRTTSFVVRKLNVMIVQ